LDLGRLRTIATETMRRGPDAFGFAWIDGAGRLKMFKQAGRLVDCLGLLAMARDARMLIGHCRFATQGRPAENLNNHPHPADGGWLIHNGIIPDYRGAIRDFRLHPVSDCDSELLGMILERRPGTFLERSIAATSLADGSPLVTCGLWSRPNRLILVRRGNPLQMGKAPEGTYFASLKAGVPDPSPLPDDSALEFCGRKVRRISI
jgi:glucosamine 6-phosphate synthetase-like amidotransferase/phosphosugar isomerase protein